MMQSGEDTICVNNMIEENIQIIYIKSYMCMITVFKEHLNLITKQMRLKVQNI